MALWPSDKSHKDQGQMGWSERGIGEKEIWVDGSTLNRHNFKLVYETVTRKKTVLEAIIVCGKREREGEGEEEEWSSGCGLR